MSPSVELNETGLESDPVIIIRRSVRSLVSVLFLLGFSMVVIGALSLSLAEIRGSWLAELLASDWLPIIPVAIAFELVRRSSNCLYVFNPFQFTALQGSKAFGFIRPTVDYTDIAQISVSQHALGKFLNYGTVHVVTGEAKKRHIDITGVRAPMVVAALLAELKGGRRELIRIGEHAYLADRASYPHRLAA